MTVIELERMIHLALRHKCGVTHLEQGEAAMLAASLSTAPVDFVAKAIAAHASRRGGDNVIDLRQAQRQREIREMFEGFVALADSLRNTRTTG